MSANDDDNYMQAWRDGEKAWRCEMLRKARQRESANSGKNSAKRVAIKQPAEGSDLRSEGEPAQHDLSVLDEPDDEDPPEAENTPEIQRAREAACKGLLNMFNGVEIDRGSRGHDEVAVPKEHVDPRSSDAYMRLVEWGRQPCEIARLESELVEYTYQWRPSGERR